MEFLFLPPPPHLLEISGASALSLHKKQSSTYIKYACGCFLYAPSICIVYFQKTFQYRHGWRGHMQQRRFCEAKTRRQQMYTEVHLLAGYLYCLFPKVFFRNIWHIRFLAVLNHSKFAYSLAFLLKEINSSQYSSPFGQHCYPLTIVFVLGFPKGVPFGRNRQDAVL